MILSPNEDRWDGIVRGPASLENVPVALVKAVIWNESRFSYPVPDRIEHPPWLGGRSTASIGVMQILPETALWIMCQPGSQRENIALALRDPASNILIGTRLLGAYLNGWRPGDPPDCIRRASPLGPLGPEDVLAAYNGGEGAIGHPNSQVRAYIAEGMRAYQYFFDREAPAAEPDLPPAPGDVPGDVIASVAPIIAGAAMPVLTLAGLAALGLAAFYLFPRRR